MRSTLTHRRALRFRPATFNRRHLLVARLIAIGFSRLEVATLAGYSITHVSRIAQMRRCKQEIARRLAKLVADQTKQLVRELSAFANE